MVTFGLHTIVGRAMLKLLRTSIFKHCTIVDMSKDLVIERPTRCGSRVDTQRSVISCHNFGAIVFECLMGSALSSVHENDNRVLFRCCNGGGPSTVLANVEMYLLNAIKIAPACQFPALECFHWCLHRSYLGNIEETLVEIANWVAEPERGRTIVEEAPELSRPLALGFPLEYGDEACQFAVRVAVGGGRAY